ncbi:hypothetical protein P8605_04840 [Streptomyces sp. T-3]|nr:hypothetical protein [Streptomyces sp. T-3]
MSGLLKVGAWTLADRYSTVLYVGICECRERSTDGIALDEAQRWCLDHAQSAGHVSFELRSYRHLEARRIGRAQPPASQPDQG